MYQNYIIIIIIIIVIIIIFSSDASTHSESWPTFTGLRKHTHRTHHTR